MEFRLITKCFESFLTCKVHSKFRIRRNPQRRHHRPGTIRDFAANEKECSVSDVNAFVNIDNDIAICSQATVKALTSEFLEEKQNSSGEDSDAKNMDQTPPNKAETIEALEKVRRYLTSIQGTTNERFKALSILEKKVTISSNHQLHQSTLMDYFNVPK
ncbi:hypothetical protein AVEN_34709-1 [Araneus ventricosus]|uniref:Uncharacterized protein n=1 Tax=Araneus ventricosus TaxID=182803 RepID=A0A4Y2B268_ARAVE|nr:hypothetical protein AVEN_34709-1 [Araneus ventricosus]